jgi:hypothetical protein
VAHKKRDGKAWKHTAHREDRPIREGSSQEVVKEAGVFGAMDEPLACTLTVAHRDSGKN